MRYLFPLSALIAVALTLTGVATGANPNVRGVVVGLAVSPACVSGEPCDPPARPVLAFTRAGTVTVSRVRVGANGHFAATLAPGLYAVRLLPAGAGGRVIPARVRVTASGPTHLTIRVTQPAN